MKHFSTFFVLLIVFFGCSSNENVTIPDPNLAAGVRETLGLNTSDPIPRKKLEKIKASEC